jgi:hypothetical protein
MISGLSVHLKVETELSTLLQACQTAADVMHSGSAHKTSTYGIYYHYTVTITTTDTTSNSIIYHSTFLTTTRF